MLFLLSTLLGNSLSHEVGKSYTSGLMLGLIMISYHFFTPVATPPTGGLTARARRVYSVHTPLGGVRVKRKTYLVAWKREQI